MKVTSKVVLSFLTIALGIGQLWTSEATAQSSYFTSRGCVSCHSAPVVTSCNACHYHGNRSLQANTNKTSYAPGEAVTVTLTSGSTRTGWIKAILYNQSNTQVAASNGNASGMGGSTTYPAALTAPAPTTPGTYTWKMAYFGNSANSGDVHGEAAVNTNSFTVTAPPAPVDTTAPTVSTFTVPATSTSLSVTGITFSATDAVGVTGFRLTETATAPLAAAAGWTVAAPASYTFATAGVKTLYAWAKDAAGNVSLAKSASVTITLPDTAAPLVSVFTLPAAATSLIVPVTVFTATDNVGVTGYSITRSATAPSASATTGWTASAPTSVSAATSGTTLFYAWAKDAAGNVSLAKSASVNITLADTAAPVVSVFTLPATATSLIVPVTVFTATDNVGVTGYSITRSATVPSASATTGWSASAPTSVTATASGSTLFYAWVKDAAGNVSLAKSASVTVTITTADITKPTLAISALANGAYTNTATLNISGNASDAGGLQSVTVSGAAVVVNPDGSFSAALTLVVGANTVTVIATDKAGNQQTDIRTITFDPAAPVLTVSAPADNSSSTQSFSTLTGTINETSTVTVTNNNGSPQSAIINGNNFTATVNLVPGVNTIVITAIDLAGNSVSAKRTVTYDSGKMTLAVTYPIQDITTSNPSLVLKGTVDALSLVTVKITMNGQTFRPQVINGTFAQKLTFTQAKLYAITVTATDANGNISSVSRNVIYRPIVIDQDHDDESDDDDDDRDDD